MSAPAESNVMRGAVRAVRAAGPMEAHFALTEVREGRYETPVLLACVAECGGGCRLGAKVGAARGATAYEALARAQMFASSGDVIAKAEAFLDAFGGDIPKWLRPEAHELAVAIARAKSEPLSPNVNDPTKNAGSRLDLTSGGESEVARR